MDNTPQEIKWLDLMDAGFRLYLDDGNLVLDRMVRSVPDEIKDHLLKAGFHETAVGFSGPYSVLTAFSLSRLPGAKTVSMGHPNTLFSNRGLHLEKAKNFIEDFVSENPSVLKDNYGVDDFLNDLAFPGEEPEMSENPESSESQEEIEESANITTEDNQRVVKDGPDELQPVEETVSLPEEELVSSKDEEINGLSDIDELVGYELEQTLIVTS